MNCSLILSARRSPVQRRNGAFAILPLEDLAAPVIQAVVQDAGIGRDAIDDLIVSNALAAGGNPARIVALKAGFLETVAGLTIDRQCCGGLDALIVADAMLKSGLADVVVAGGVESYSRQPIRLRTFADGRAPEQYHQAQFTPWADRDPDMAQAAQHLAELQNITRSEQDDWAISSHAKALNRACSDAMVAVLGEQKDGFTRRLSPRHCALAPTVFGDITSANMAVAADGAAFVVMCSAEYAQNMGLGGVQFVTGKTLGGPCELPGLAPIAAINWVLDQTGLTVGDLQVAEVMEAFAVQAIACAKGAHIPVEIINPNGGALARGHPIGASGTILAVELFHQLQKTGGAGLAAIAAAGGLGTAVILRSD